MIVKNDSHYNGIKQAAQQATRILKELKEMVKVGVSAAQIDSRMWELCNEINAKPSFFGVKGEYGPFEYSCCVSVNDAILHGIPNDRTVFKQGDIVKLDLGIVLNGFYTDQCFTVIVGNPDDESKKLVNIARLAVETAMKKAVSGVRAGELGYTMEGVARAAGFDTLKMFVGHGVGKSLHEFPEIPSFGPANRGDKLKNGMVICVECQVVEGDGEVYIDEDGWTIRSQDGGRGAMFEYMVIVRDDNPEILTQMQDWGVITKN